MPRWFTYIVMFAALVLLQTMFLDNLGLSLYVRPQLYIAFIALLPMDMKHGWLLVSGFVLGLAMDAVTAGAGLNCACALLTAFARPAYLRAVLSRDELREGGMPHSARVGPKKFLIYTSMLAAVHCAAYFSLEAATWSHFYLTALRIACSTAASVALTFLFQLFYSGR